MKVCMYQKCGKEFEPLKPKAVFCSAKCRVYQNRLSKKKVVKEKNKVVIPEKEIPEKKDKVTDTETTVKESTKGLTAFQIYQRQKLGLK